MDFAPISYAEINYKSNIPNRITKPTVGAAAGGIVLGQVANSTINTVAQMQNARVVNGIKQICSEHADCFEQVTKAVSDTLNKEGLIEKGVKFVDVSSKDSSAVCRIVEEEFTKNKIIKKLPKALKNHYANTAKNMFLAGDNAAYLPKTKTVMVSGDKLGLTLFHEVGHSLNANKSIIGKVLQSIRGVNVLAIPIALIAVFKSPKMEGQEPKGVVDKTTTFVKKHAGKLTFATFIPMLIEEGMASIKGCKIAKSVSPEIFKATCKVNALAYLTYLGVAVGAGVGIAVARNIRDKVAINSIKKKQEETQQMMEQYEYLRFQN